MVGYKIWPNYSDFDAYLQKYSSIFNFPHVHPKQDIPAEKRQLLSVNGPISTSDYDKMIALTEA